MKEGISDIRNFRLPTVDWKQTHSENITYVVCYSYPNAWLCSATSNIHKLLLEML